MRARPLIARVVSVLLTLSVGVGPLASAMHATQHVVRAAPLRYEPHDETAHRHHRPLSDHPECALCAHLKISQALAATRGATAFRAPPILIRTVATALPKRDAFLALPAPRGPPIAS